MSAHCCDHETPQAATIVNLARYRKILWIALIVNAIMFVVEIGAGLGSLTLALAETGAHVMAVEVDAPPEARWFTWTGWFAEHAVALIMTLNRKTHKAYNRIREGNFSLEKLDGFDLYGKTVGVIGTGRIGEAFANIMIGFGCRVLAFDIMPNKDLQARGVEYLPLIDLLSQSRIISLHCPLNDQTHHLINAETLSVMQRGSMLINTSRGGLINTADVIEALKKGHLGYLGIDVYEPEEKLFFYDRSGELIDDDDILRLISFPNVLITSHQGFFTEEALTQIAITTLGNITDFEAGKALENVVR